MRPAIAGPGHLLRRGAWPSATKLSAVMKAAAILRARVVGELVRSRALSRLNRDQLRPNASAREPLHGRVWLDSKRAVRCAEEDCPAIYDEANGNGCPRCGSSQAVPIARAINGATNEERRVS
jgi:hypothetical protein